MSLNAPAGSSALPVKKTPALSLKGRECTFSRVTTLLHSCLTTATSVGIRTAEYPDAVTFVSYVAAYSPSEDSCFGCAAQGGIQAEVLRAPLILRLLSVRLSLSSTCSRQSLSGMLDLYKSGFIISAGKIFVKPRLSILLQEENLIHMKFQKPCCHSRFPAAPASISRIPGTTYFLG